MNVLITGANGYVGRQLADALALEGHRITALMRRPAKEPFHHHVTSLVAEEYNSPHWMEGSTFKNIDVVIHTAGRVHQRRSAEKNDTEIYKRDNVDLSMHIAKKARNAGVKRFIFISTIGAQILEDQFHQGRGTWKEAWMHNPYRASKLEAERQLITFGKKNGMEIVCIRLPLIYGKGAPGNFATLLGWVKKGFPIPFGGLQNKRPYISIETVIQFVSLCLGKAQAVHKKWSIRDRDEISPAEFTYALARAARIANVHVITCPNSLIKLVAFFFGLSRTANNFTEQIHIDLAPTREKLGWAPAFSVEEGLKKALE